MNEFKQLLVEFLNSDIILYAMYIFLFGLIFYIVYSMLNYFKYHSRMKKTIQNLYAQMSAQEKLRAENERRERDIHGAGVKRDFLGKIDERLAYSGIKDTLKWITTEIYIVIVLLIVATVITISTMKAGFIIGILLGIAVYAVFELIISLLIAYRNKQTETIMLQFMNIVDNFSKTSDNLIAIFEKAARYIDEPLSTQILDAVTIAKNSGDKLGALQELQDRVKNRHFKVLVRNLEISSRYETNYSDIIEDCRGIFHNYIRNEKEKRVIKQQGLLDIGTMGVAGVMCVSLLGDVSESSNLILTLINGGIFEHFVLGYLVITVLVTMYMVIFRIFKHGD